MGKQGLDVVNGQKPLLYMKKGVRKEIKSVFST